jgi:hypothetical protein
MERLLVEQVGFRLMKSAGVTAMLRRNVEKIQTRQERNARSMYAAPSLVCIVAQYDRLSPVMLTEYQGFCGMTADFCNKSNEEGKGCQSNCDQPPSGGKPTNVQDRVIGYYVSSNIWFMDLNMILAQVQS